MDVGLTIDALALVPRVDHIVLCSGNADFRPLVANLQAEGVRVSVLSTFQSRPPLMADELRRQADNFIDLDDLKDVLGKAPVRASGPS